MVGEVISLSIGQHLRVTVRSIQSGLNRRLSRSERALHRRVLKLGHRVECPICSWSGFAFAASRKPRRWNRLCPECGSSERDRALQLWILDRPPPRPRASLLEVAPLGLLATQVRQLGYRYTSLDLMSPKAHLRADLSILPLQSRSLALVVCFHVLEHVHDDRAAVREISRVLIDDGIAVIVVPWNRSAQQTDEDLTAGPDERLRRFGQIDHVWTYGRDVTARFEACGVHVKEVRFSDAFTADQCRSSALDGDDDRFWLLTPSGR